jgi:SAM-dependent methyltransferase
MSGIFEHFHERVGTAKTALRSGRADLSHIEGKKLLEVGSGFGTAAIACEQAGVAEYLGVDLWPFGSMAERLDNQSYGIRLIYEQAMPMERHGDFNFFEGPVEKLVSLKNYFDFAFMVDVLEHVPDEASKSIARTVFEMLKPGGTVITQTGGLWLSSLGHHLWDTPWSEPWAHLKANYHPSLEGNGVSPFRLDAYLTLGKTTHAEIKERFVGAGFEVAREFVGYDSLDLWLQHKDGILPEFTDRYPEDVFRQNISEYEFVKPASA